MPSSIAVATGSWWDIVSRDANSRARESTESVLDGVGVMESDSEGSESDVVNLEQGR